MGAEPMDALSAAHEKLDALKTMNFYLHSVLWEQREFIFGSVESASAARIRLGVLIGRQQTEVARLERLAGTADGRMADSMMDDARTYGSGGN